MAAAPELRAYRFHMRYLDARPCAASYLDRFGVRGKHAREVVAFGADVRRVQLPALGSRFRDADHLFRERIGAGRVPEAGGHTQRAGVEAIRNQPDHCGQLVRVRRARVHAQHGRADCAVADLCGDVDRRAGLFKRVEIAVKVGPRWLQSVARAFHPVSELVSRHADQRRAEAVAAIACQFQRHALRHLGIRKRVDEKRRVGVRMQIDETGRHDFARCVNRQGRLIIHLPDSNDLVALNCQVCGETRRAGAVDYRAVFYDYVQHFL